MKYMKLEDYRDFDEKKKFFHHETIESVEKFDSWLFTFESSEPALGLKFIYRGLNEAKYKNYTSSQRDWLTNEWSKVLNISYVDYVDRLLGHIRKNSLLYDYFTSLGIAPNDILYLSFMQHYAMPSPLLDFTRDLRIALFFAIDGLKRQPSSAEIDNYFSIYAILPTNEYAPADSLFGDGIESAKSMLNDFKKEHSDASINDELLRNIDLLTKWKKTDGTKDGLHAIPLMYIPNPQDATPVVNTSGQRLYWSNPNIIAQKGCFIMNSSDTEVLEEVVVNKKFMKPIMCIDIHKSLAEYIKIKYLHIFNQDNIYPKFKKIVDQAYDDFKSGL